MSYFQEDDSQQTRKLKEKIDDLQGQLLDLPFSSSLENVDSAQSTFPTANPSSRGDGSGTGGGQTNPEIRPRVDHGTVGLATVQIDLSVPGGNFHKMILSGDIGLAFTNPPVSGQVERLILEIKQDGTGEHDVTSWGTLVNPPTLDTAPNATTRIEIYTDDNGVTYEALSVTFGSAGDHSVWANFVAINDVDLQSTFNLKDFSSIIQGGGSSAQTGAIKLGSGIGDILWRNAAGTADIGLRETSLDELEIDIPFQPTLAKHGLVNLGQPTQSWDQVNADMIAFRHNDGIITTVPSIGRSSENLRINAPNLKNIQMEIDGNDVAVFDNLGLEIPNLRRIQLTTTGNPGTILKTTGNPIQYVSPEGSLFESGAGTLTPQIATIRGDIATIGQVPAQIVFQGDNDAAVPTDYGSIRVRILNNLAAGINSSMEFYAFDGNVNKLQLELNGNLSKILVHDRLELQSGHVLSIDDQYLEIKNPRASPGQSGTTRNFFLDINNSDHASIVTPSGIIDLEAGGSSSNFGLSEVIQTSTTPPPGTVEDIYITNTHTVGAKLTIGAALLANAVYCFPIIIGKSVTAKEIRVYVETGQSSPLGRMDLGIYDSRTDGAIYPKTLLDSATNILVATSGQFVSGAINVALSPGIYWLVMTVDNRTTLELQAHDGGFCHSVGAFEAASSIENIAGFLDQGQSTFLATWPDDEGIFTTGSGGQVPAIYLRCE